MDPSKYSYKPYNKIYPELFEKEKQRLLSQLDSVEIEHFGSSAVPNLGGKGIIDIYVVTSKKNIKSVSLALQDKLGYEFRPNGGDAQRLFFKHHKNDQTYHLHLTDVENPNFKESISLRDYLITHPKDAKKYDNVKKRASKLAMASNNYKEQKETYQKTKADLLTKLNTKANNRVQKE